MSAIEKHPQRQQIVDAILNGDSLRNIAATVAPPVHFTTLSRFRLNLLGRASKGVHAKGSIATAIKDLCSPADAKPDVQQRLRDELQQSIQRDRARYEGWLEDAEERPVLDKLGNPMLGADGRVLRVMDHRALAAHSRNGLSAIELRAKLAGLLQDSATNVAVQIAVLSNDSAPAGEIIELKAIR